MKATCILLVLLGAAGCAEVRDRSPADNTPPRETAAQVVDTSDPHAVAVAFFTAMSDGDFETAALHVLSEDPEDRSAFEEDFKNAPPIPDIIEVEIEQVSAEIADARLLNSEIESDMRFQDGRWWISKH